MFKTQSRSAWWRYSLRELVSIKRACAIAGVSRTTIYNWLRAGKLEHVRTIGGAVRIYADALFRKDLDRKIPGSGTEQD